MLYSDVIQNKWHLLLKKKDKYTITDINKIKKLLPILTEKQARFVVICTAAFYDADITKAVDVYNNTANQIKRMIA